MPTALDAAFAKAQQLPQADQERIGRELSDYVDHLKSLREDLARGVESLDAGRGREVDIEALISRARTANG